MDTGKIVVTGKGNKTRFVYLGKVTRQSVWRYLSERFPNETPPDDEPLFVDSYRIHRLTRQGIILLVKRLGKRAGVDNVFPHRFRHTFAVQFLRNGGNVFCMSSEQMGHKGM